MKKNNNNNTQRTAVDMMRDCNLELRLTPPSPFQHRQENPSEDLNMGGGGNLKEKQNQQLTIFYDGRVIVYDVTELRARTIIKLASEEMRTPSSTTSSEPSSSLLKTSNKGEVSKKRSLERFLHKRKHRTQANFPHRP